MQALILAAGMGKRLGELTADRTKCMVELFGKPLIVRLLEQLDRYGIKHTTIVVGYRADDLQQRIGCRFGNVEIKYIENPVYDKTNNIYSFYLAKDVLLTDDTVLFESDLVFDDAVLTRLLSDPRADLAVVAQYQSWMDGTVCSLEENDTIIKFTPKNQFDRNQVDEYYKTVNIYRFSKKVSQSHYVPFLEAYCSAMGHNDYYEQVFRLLAHLDHFPMKALRLVQEKWYEIDDIHDLANAERLFASEDKLQTHYIRGNDYEHERKKSA